MLVVVSSMDDDSEGRAITSLMENAVRKQIDYLVHKDTLRTEDGILSHRTDKLQLWVDGIYMVRRNSALHESL